MLVNLDKRVAFAHIPKTGGASIGEVFRENGFVDYLDPHINRLCDFPNFLKVCMIRNPYEIVASYYVHNLESGVCDNEVGGFSWFVKTIGDYRSGRLILKQHKYALDCQIVMRYENYDDDFKNFCDLINIKWRKPSNIHKFREYKWQDYYNDEDKRLVKEKAYMDFNILGY